MTIQELASQMNNAFTTAQRDNGETFWKLRDGSPEWMTDVIRESHDGRLPDDDVYESIAHSVEYLADGGDPEESHEHIDSMVDVYTSQLTKWLASHSWNNEYLDRAHEEYPDSDNVLGVAQYLFHEEIFQALVHALEDQSIISMEVAS